MPSTAAARTAGAASPIGWLMMPARRASKASVSSTSASGSCNGNASTNSVHAFLRTAEFLRITAQMG